MKRSKLQMKPSRLATIALTVMLSATLLTFASPSASNAMTGGNDELSEGVNLQTWWPNPTRTPGGHLRVGLNEYFDGNPSFVGGIEMYFLVPGCAAPSTRYECSRFYMAYC